MRSTATGPNAGGSRPQDKIYSSPALGADGAIYVGSLDGYLYALEPDGSLRWKVNLRDWVISSPAVGADGTIYVGSYNHALYAISPAGKIAWKHRTEKGIFSSPTIADDGTLYFGSDDGRLYALKTESRGLARRRGPSSAAMSGTAAGPRAVGAPRPEPR